MATSNATSIVINHIDTGPIDQSIKDRAIALGGQMSPEAGQQLINDMQAFHCEVTNNGDTADFKAKMDASYLIDYLKDHGTPVSGGDGGIVHDVDGSTYESRVPERLQGTSLPWFELPVLDCEEEIYHIIEIMAPDAVQNAISNSKKEIFENIVKPQVQQTIMQELGGLQL